MFIDLARSRRSIRRFADTPVEKEKVDTIIEAVLRAPSSKGCMPWEFVVVTEPETIAQLAACKPKGAAFLKDAPLALAICVDPKVTEVWVEDAAIASVYAHLAATDLGLGSCWIQLRMRHFSDQQTASARAVEILGLPDGMEVLSLVAIGYPLEEKAPHPADSLLYKKVHYNRFGQQG